MLDLVAPVSQATQVCLLFWREHGSAFRFEAILHLLEVDALKIARIIGVLVGLLYLSKNQRPVLLAQSLLEDQFDAGTQVKQRILQMSLLVMLFGIRFRRTN